MGYRLSKLSCVAPEKQTDPPAHVPKHVPKHVLLKCICVINQVIDSRLSSLSKISFSRAAEDEADALRQIKSDMRRYLS
jgi:hypothetical protein